jgi:hypothetical protein
MPRIVSPWTWRRALRDHGPKSPSVLLTLYTIGTFMDRSGFAFPSQQLIAAGIRASVKTVQRHLDQAAHAGWIAVEIAGRSGKGWRHYVYRAAVPDHLDLDYVDEEIADAIQAQEGGIGGDTTMSPRTPAVTPALQEALQDRGDIHGAKVTTSEPHRGDTGVQMVATQLCRTNSRSETPAYRTHASAKLSADAPSAPNVSAKLKSEDSERHPEPRSSRGGRISEEGFAGRSTEIQCDDQRTSG